MQKILSVKLIKLFIILAVCALLIFLSPKKILDPVRDVVFRIIYPFQKTFYSLGNSGRGGLDFLGSISELKEENKRLIKENDSLVSQIAKLESVKKENELLREQLNLPALKNFDLVRCFVIGQDLQKTGSWIFIDEGRNAGIEAGMPVVFSDGILIGKVDEVYGSSSRVTLLSDSGSLVNVQDLETGAKGILRGEYGLGMILDLVSQTEIINDGDTIITSGLDGNMPKGLLIGKIYDIKLSEDKLFQQSFVTPRVKYSKLELVSVIRNK